MASYPGAVKTFTAKVDGAGNTIMAAHVNDIQDEVNAIEAGLLQGTAPLNSSGSTLGTLSVIGGSTFGVRPVTPPPAAISVTLGSTVTISSGGVTAKVNWLGDDLFGGINSSLHSTGTNSSRFTPDSTGVWGVCAQAVFNQNSSGGYRYLQAVDSSGVLMGEVIAKATTSIEPVLMLQGFKRFDALGGYCVITAGQDGVASTLSLSTAGGNTKCTFWKL